MSYWELMLATAALGVGLTAVVFWIWMLVDCLRHETPNEHNRLVWALVIIFLKIVGAVVYYFMRFRPRRLSVGGQSPSTL